MPEIRSTVPPPDNLCAFILTHRRPDRVITLDTLSRNHYTGPLYLVVDEEDPTLPEYRRRYGDSVVTFSKAAIEPHFDIQDNFRQRKGAVVYARNAAFDLAEQLGYRYFFLLDDDYTDFNYRTDHRGRYTFRSGIDLNQTLHHLLDYFRSIPALSITIAQGGDYMGGGGSTCREVSRVIGMRRKAMNSFICDTQRRFQFTGRVNEDVNAYTLLSTRGELFFTYMPLALQQITTQRNPGGLSETYLDAGTYVKSFYTVMLCPSATRIIEMGYQGTRRLHHSIRWRYAAPKILRESLRKAGEPCDEAKCN